MSFWNLSDNSQIDNSGAFEMGGGEMEPIPNNTGLLAAIEEAKWDEYDGYRYISLRWRVIGGQHENRVIFQKMKVFGTNSCKDRQATADKAKRMLAAIDANAGGNLLKIQGEPSDVDLMSALTGKVMAIKVQVWEMEINGEKKSGNWISAVAPRGKTAPATAPAPQPEQPEPIDDDLDSIPF